MDLDAIFTKADQLHDEGKYKKAFKKFLYLAEHGDTSGMTRLASMYYNGEGVDFDLDKSMAWDRKAVELGDCSGMNNLACTYRCMGDIREAKKWFEKALEAGHGGAALALANMYLVSDKEVERTKSYLRQVLKYKYVSEYSREEAKAILDELSGKARKKGISSNKASNKNGAEENEKQINSLPSMKKPADLDARFAKADRLYDEGKYRQAFRGFLYLAEHGDVDAMTRVALMYHYKEGTDFDFDESVAWDTKAAELGSSVAMNNLACTYRCMGDIRQAKKWFEKALEAGDGDAALALAKMYLVTDKEIERTKFYLQQVLAHKNAGKHSREEAKIILDELSGKTDVLAKPSTKKKNIAKNKPQSRDVIEGKKKIRSQDRKRKA